MENLPSSNGVPTGLQKAERDTAMQLFPNSKHPLCYKYGITITIYPSRTCSTQTQDSLFTQLFISTVSLYGGQITAYVFYISGSFSFDFELGEELLDISILNPSVSLLVSLLLLSRIICYLMF